MHESNYSNDYKNFFIAAVYFDFFAVKRGKKYWARFVEQLRIDYGGLFTEDFLRRLAEV